MFDDGGMTGQLTRATALLAEVTAAISSETSGPAAREALVDALALSRQVDLAICLLTERVERSGQFAADGSVTMASWLRAEAHCSPGWAAHRVATGRALIDQLPAARAAWTAGDLGFEHLAVIRRATDGLSPAQIGYLDVALASAGATCSPKELADIAAALTETIAPDKSEKDRERKTASQKVHLSDVPDGGRLDGDLDAESTAILRAALEKYMPKPGPRQLGDGTLSPALTASHRRALALIEMARQSLDFGTDHPGAANKPHLIVSVTADQLAAGLGVGYQSNGTPLAASTLRRLACDAKIIPLVLGSDSLPLDIGRTSRTIPAWIRTALNHRDKGCRHPDCDRPPSWCDAHHVTHWIDGGETNLDQLLLLCRHHHTRLHKGEFTITAHGNQRFTITKHKIHIRT